MKIISFATYNDSERLSSFLEKLKKFTEKDTLLLVADGGSEDGTRKFLRDWAKENKFNLEIFVYPIIGGQGEMYRILFENAMKYQSETCAVLDIDSENTDPAAIKKALAFAKKEGYDFIAPIYQSHRFDGAIDTVFSTPLLLALFGRATYPVGGKDFIISKKLITRLLSKRFWEYHQYLHNESYFLITALAEKYKICSFYFGSKHIDPKDFRAFGPIFLQKAVSFFKGIEEHPSIWQKKERQIKIKAFNLPKKQLSRIPPFSLPQELFISQFKKSFPHSQNVFRNIFPARHFFFLKELNKKEKKNFFLPSPLWAEMVYDIAIEFCKGSFSQKQLLDALLCIFWAEIASFYHSLEKNKIEAKEIRESFVKKKRYLLKYWPVSKSFLDQWFSKNKFHCKRFSKIDELVKLKKKQKLTIGLCILAKNEEDSIYHTIEIIKESLFDKKHLLDEIIVVDGGSRDKTVKEAKRAKVKVYPTSSVLPHIPPVAGDWKKGEDLWKSIYLLNTDILVWVDADILSIGPQFVYGTIGPLLKYPKIGHCIGFYQRPIKIGKTIINEEGGRVTELTVRPILNTFFPDLSQIIQPLSGEYAIRREVIEKIPIFTNYALETCMLIDIYSTFGLDVIAQVDLGKKVHKNKPLSVLAKRSFGIIQAIFNRLNLHGKIKLLLEPVVKQGRYNFEEMIVTEAQKPPMIELPEYQKKFKNRKPKWPKK